MYCQMYAPLNRGFYALFSTREEHSHLFGQASEPHLLHQDIPGWDHPPDGTQVSHSRTDSKKPRMFSPGGSQPLAYPGLHMHRWETGLGKRGASPRASLLATRAFPALPEAAEQV